ncbi:MAG: hypothetical protein JWP81_5009 [Ferruginibacter sp.]|nr:hypothetical protein [Ferruginibacter sp.]
MSLIKRLGYKAGLTIAAYFLVATVNELKVVAITINVKNQACNLF